MKLPVFALLLAVALVPFPARAASISGVATLPSVVWITGQAAPPVTDASIRQTKKEFIPNLLVVPAGSSVKFPNDDAYYHSVYSVSASNPFDLGLYDTGPGKNVVFANSGVVDVRCHVHGTMRATIVVVDGPYAVTTKPGERYKLVVPPGPHELHVWKDGWPVLTTRVVAK